MNPRRVQKVTAIFDIFDRYPREYFVLVFFVFFVFLIVWQTFSLTVLNYGFYRELADKQQIGELEVPVTRGTIFSAGNIGLKDGVVFSTSVDLSDLAIDPMIEGNKEKLQDFLVDTMYKQMCYLKTRQDCYEDMLKFTKNLQISGFNTTESYIKELITEKIDEKLAKTKVTSVRLKEGLSPADEQEILTWGITGVYPNESGLYINPEELQNPDDFVLRYQALFGGEAEDILHSVRKRNLRYMPIYQKLSLVISEEIESFIKDEQAAIRQGVIEKQESISGYLILTPHAQRIYPERSVGSQIIGFTDNSGEGRYGVEGYFDEELRGNPGELVSKKDIKGRPIDPISFGDEDTDAQEGVNIYTTIDRNIQKIVEDTLELGVKRYNANKGTVVVMQPKTGRILSLANYPSYDPNSPGDVYELKKVLGDEFPTPETDLLGRTVLVEDIVRGEPYFYNGKQILLREAGRSEYSDPTLNFYTYQNSFGAAVYQNDAVSALYEPGSIMKAITVAVGIDAGEIRPYDRYNDIGEVTIDNFTIANVDNRCLGYNTFTHALSFSCNVGMIRIVQRLGKALLHKYLVDFGFGSPTGVTLAGEVYSELEPYERWPTSKLLTTSYGLGISATPLQMATAYSVIANGGVYMAPYIVDKIEFTDGEVIEYKPRKLRRVIKESTAKSVTNMLQNGIEEGVAANGGVEGYSVAGKTGTSQIAYRGRYEEGVGSTHASFAGFAPAQDPEFVIIVKLDRPRTNQYGGRTSAVIFSELTQALLKYYQIPQKKEQK